jgi:hypothetical protein
MKVEEYSKEYMISKQVHPILANVLKIHSNKDNGDSLLEFFINNRNKMGDTILNIGISGDECSHSWIHFFLDVLNFKKITIVEYHKPNFDFVYGKFKDDPRVSLLHGDVRELDTFLENNSDCSFWWHGPEHIPLGDLPKALSQLKGKTKKSILWACPWGNYYANGAGAYLGDGHHFYPENHHFSDLGMDVMNTGGPKDTGNANIFAYNFFENKDE